MSMARAPGFVLGSPLCGTGWRCVLKPTSGAALPGHSLVGYRLALVLSHPSPVMDCDGTLMMCSLAEGHGSGPLPA